MTATGLDSRAAAEFIDEKWDGDIVPQLVEYIRIPNKSPMFDKDWQANGHMDAAVQLMESWARAQAIPGLHVEVVRLEGRTPLIYAEIPASGPDAGEDTVLLYGHLDKQPEMTGWDADLGPWIPVLKGDRLYGRGGADDGYALFGSLAAIQALQRQGVPHARCVLLIEACEESGSYDLPAYVDHLGRAHRQALAGGVPGFGLRQLRAAVVHHLAARGAAGGNLTVNVLNEGVHSGDASGIVPSSFRLLRQLLSRLEDENTGRIRVEGLFVEVPAERQEQAGKVAGVLGDEVFSKFPFLDGMSPMSDDLTELVLNRTWRPALSVTGVDGMPPLSSAGNVLRPHTSVKLSLRLPPTPDGKRAGELLKEVLLKDPPNGARGRTGTGEGLHRLERAGAVTVADRGDRGSVAGGVRQAGDVHGRRRHDPVHGHARREVPGRAVHDHRRARPALQCAWPERVPAHPDGQARDPLRLPRDRRALPLPSARGDTTGVGAVAGGQAHGDHGCC